MVCNYRGVIEGFTVLSLRRRILQVRRDSVFLSSLYWSLPLPRLPHPHHQSDHGSFQPAADHTPIPTHTTTLNAATHLHGTDAGMLLLVLTVSTEMTANHGGSDICQVFVWILILYCICKLLNRLDYCIVTDC